MFFPGRIRRLVACLLPLFACSLAVIQAEEPAAQPPAVTRESVAEALLQQVYLDLAFPAGQLPNLGLEVVDPEPALRSQLDLPADQGLVVASVVPDSAAATAGIQQNDVLLTLNEKAVGSAELFRQAITALHKADKEAGSQPLTLTLLRGGKKITVAVSIKLAELDRLVGQLYLTANIDSQKYWIGVAVADIDGTLRAQLNLPEKQGLVVTEVKAESAAEKAGIKIHDVLLEFNEKALATADDLRQVVTDLGKDAKSGSMKLLRGGKPATLPVTPVEKKLEVAYVKEPEAILKEAFSIVGRDNKDLNAYRIWSAQNARGKGVVFTVPTQTEQVFMGLNSGIAKAESAAPSADQFKELLDAIQQLSRKVESLEQSIKKSEGSSGK